MKLYVSFMYRSSDIVLSMYFLNQCVHIVCLFFVSTIFNEMAYFFRNDLKGGAGSLLLTSASAEVCGIH